MVYHFAIILQNPLKKKKKINEIQEAHSAGN